MPTVTFGRAERKGTHTIITAYGESGCGKTYSLIKLGRGLVGPKGKLGMLDTETGRGLIYANVAGGYDYAELTPPFTPERYIEAIDAAEAAGIEALIIDSGSHEWEGIGGVLEMADAQTSRQGEELKGLIKWAKPKARHKKYVHRLLTSRMHLLISLRAKERMVQLTDKMPIPRGAKVGDIISAGYTPIQDKRFIFETTVQLFLPTSTERNKLGIPIVEKCPEDLWGAFPDGEHISEETGRKIAEWVNGGAPVDQEYERLKRAAEEAAGGGTEALRNHWRRLNAQTRDRLGHLIDNLASIARTADQEQEDRRREREGSHTAFRHVESDTDRDPQDETPFGLPPTGEPQPPSPAGVPQGNPAISADVAAPAGGDLLQPSSTPRLFKIPRNPTAADFQAFADWIDAELADGTPGLVLRADNRSSLDLLKRANIDLYDSVQRRLAGNG